MRFKQDGVVTSVCFRYTRCGWHLKFNYQESLFDTTAKSYVDSTSTHITWGNNICSEQNCTKHILPDNYGTVPGVENLMKQLHVWIRITLGIPQIQSYIKSVIVVRGTKRSSPLDIQEQ